MECPTCHNKFAYRMMTVFTAKNGKIQVCDHCTSDYKPESRIGTFIRNIEPGSKGKRTVAHDMDIRSRRLNPEGQVVRVNPGQVRFTGFGIKK